MVERRIPNAPDLYDEPPGDSWPAPDDTSWEPASSPHSAPVAPTAPSTHGTGIERRSGAHARRNGHRSSSHDRPLPHDLDVERSLLGSAFYGGIDTILGVPPAAYYSPQHATIAAAVLAITPPGENTNPVLLANHLADAGHLDTIGGPATIARLVEDGAAATVAPRLAEIVLGYHRARTIIEGAAEAAETARTKGPDEALDKLRPLLDTTGPASDLAWEDVAAVVRGDYEPMRPTILARSDGQPLIYPGLLHWLMGEPGKGKTWVALYAAAEQIQDGHDVIYLDWEGNRQIIGERLAALGCTADQVDRHLAYLRPPAITPRIAAAIAARARQGATLAICDGVAKALARQDLNEDKAADVLAWLELVTHPITEAGAAVLCLDHVTKDRETRGLWPRGSGAKQGEVSGAAWVVRPRVAFSRDTPGEIHLVQAKDREGHVGTDGAVVARIRIQPTAGGTRLDILVDPPHNGDGGPSGFRPTALMQKLSIEIERFNAAGTHPTGRQLKQIVPGKNDHKAIALSCLLQEGWITHTPGPRRAILYRSIKPYRELDDPRSDTYRPAMTQPEDEEF